MEKQTEDTNGKEEKHSSPFHEIPDHIKEFVKTKLEYYKLMAIEQAAILIAETTALVVIAICGLFFICFLSFGAALMIGKALGEVCLGFFIVAAFYLLIVLLVFLSRKWLMHGPFVNMLITKFANKNEDAAKDK
jgi:hypothetical protein